MGATLSPEDLQRGTRPRRPVTAFRSAARVVVAVTRMRYLVRKWKRATRVGSPVMGGIVDLQQGYAPNSNSFSPPCINTQSERLWTLQQSRFIAPPFKCSSVSIQSVLFVFQLYSERPP
eukprot:XP_011421793.1 PREDICTED: uncharacterized protein LOC105324428 [Crassostrea gigas]